MASAVTPTNYVNANNGGLSTLATANEAGLNLRVLHFTGIDGTASDTFTSGIKGIVNVAWLATTTGDAVEVTFVESTGVITFTDANNDTVAGTLFIWSTH